MANIQHKDITDPNIHEPKGIALASEDEVYVANGLGSGDWKKIDTTSTPYMELTFTGSTSAINLVPTTFTTVLDATTGIVNNTSKLTVTRTGMYLLSVDLILTSLANAAEQVAINVRPSKSISTFSAIGAFHKAVSVTESSSASVTKEDVRSAPIKLLAGEELGFWLTRVGVQPFTANISGIINICRIGSD